MSGDRSVPTMDSATWCRTLAVASAARRLRPEVSKNSSTALSSNEGELARSITTCVPAMASLRPSPVMLLTPVFGEAATTSWPRWRRMGTVFEPIRPVPPITTIFIPNLLEEDEVEGEPPRHGADDLFEEEHEVRAAVRPRYGAQHLAGRHVEGGVEAGGAVADVIVGPARDLAGAQGQHRLRPVERLHLHLLASTPSRPSADRVEDQRERIVDRGVAVAIVGAKAPVAQRAEDGAQDEERERIARDVAPDLSAGLRELHQRLDQLVRRLDG